MWCCKIKIACPNFVHKSHLIDTCLSDIKLKMKTTASFCYYEKVGHENISSKRNTHVAKMPAKSFLDLEKVCKVFFLSRAAPDDSKVIANKGNGEISAIFCGGYMLHICEGDIKKE